MNKRDYLRSVGFTVGARGRFSQDMLTAIDKAIVDGIVFDDDQSKVIHTKHGDVKVEKRKRKKRGVVARPPKMPDIGWVDALDIKRTDLPDHYVVHVPATGGRKAHTTTWEICYKCGYSIQYCIDPKPVPPPWMDAASAHIEPAARNTLTLTR